MVCISLHARRGYSGVSCLELGKFKPKNLEQQGIPHSCDHNAIVSRTLDP